MMLIVSVAHDDDNKSVGPTWAVGVLHKHVSMHN
jgi:hypothetical protein